MKWNNISQIQPPMEEDILVWDESMMDCRIMSCKEDKNWIKCVWFTQDGYFDDSEPEITHWQYLPKNPNRQK